MACARVFARNEAPARGLPVPQLALELSLLECVSVCRHDVAATSAADTPARPPARAPKTPPAEVVPPRERATATPAASSRHQELDLAAIDSGTWAGPASEAAPAAARKSAAPNATPIEPEPEPVPDDEFHADAEGEPWEEERAPVRADGRDWVAEARQAWPLIRKLCRQKPPMGAVVGGLLSAAEPVRAEAGEPVTLTIRTKFDVHLSKLRDPGMREVVEWALEQALSATFRVHFVPPNEPVRGAAPARQHPASGASVAQSAATSHVYERHTAPRTTSTPASASNSGAAPGSMTNGHRPAPAQATPASRGGKTPHAGRSEIREQPAPAPQASQLEQVAREDPVVQEFTRMLNAEVAEVRALEPDEPDDF